ncbi:hypothetical protein C8A00DRAFT_38863, partial [Chaetomidium leptoderma]
WIDSGPWLYDDDDHIRSESPRQWARQLCEDGEHCGDIRFFFDVLLPSSSLKLYIGQASITYVVSVGSNTIANRLIQDIMLIDDELPMALVDTTTSFFGVCAETVIIMISSQYVGISVPGLIGLLFVIQKFYLRTFKQLRLIDIEAKAPLSAFLMETIQGIVSIRAFDQGSLHAGFGSGLAEDDPGLCVMLLAIVTTLAVTFRSLQSLGFLGPALVNLTV